MPPVGLAVLPVLFLVFDVCFFDFLVVVSVVCFCVPLAGGLAAWAANVIGMAAIAKAIEARMVFFMVSFLPGGLCPLTIP